MGGWMGGEFQRQMGVAAEPAGQGTHVSLAFAFGWELGGTDRETGRKPLWGSIVLQMNRKL